MELRKELEEKGRAEHLAKIRTFREMKPFSVVIFKSMPSASGGSQKLITHL
jgi:hypothetical protein